MSDEQQPKRPVGRPRNKEYKEFFAIRLTADEKRYVKKAIMEYRLNVDGTGGKVADLFADPVADAEVGKIPQSESLEMQALRKLLAEQKEFANRAVENQVALEEEVKDLKEALERCSRATDDEKARYWKARALRAEAAAGAGKLYDQEVF